MTQIQEFIAAAEATPTTGRDEASYLKAFQPDLDERILDLGSGRTNFSKLANVVQLDYAYTDLDCQPEYPTNPVCAIYQQLPFANESFDRVTCRWGNLHLSERGLAETFSEAFRVVRPEGWVQVTPIFSGRDTRTTISRERKDDHVITTRNEQLMRNIGLFLLGLDGVGLLSEAIMHDHDVDAGFITAATMFALLGTSALVMSSKLKTVSIQKTEQLATTEQQQAFATRMAAVCHWARTPQDRRQKTK